MSEKIENFLYNFLLIIFLWGLTIFINFVIEEPQIVIIYHSYPETSQLFPKSFIWLLPIAFSFIIFYNYLFTFLGINKRLINKVNTLFFLSGVITLVYLFYLNY